MAETSTFLAWAESLGQMTYYEILRVDERSSVADIQQAFHELSLRCHPDRFVDDGPEVAAAAAAVFKRAAEAYNVLRKPQFRQRYDAELRRAQGQPEPVRFDERKVETKQRHEQRTLFMIATTPRGKQYAAKADELLAKGNLDAARIQLISASQQEPNNDELKERLEILYEALMLEPGDFL
ncbi:MAG: DnaJ domain-containing protein [Labilithrix sp.]|nr:DnaJ domain-containing protein [Labilithrix sp.]MCW5815383.1 DnaJ domain-containing protein [Labilithrix sp.]